MSGLIQNYEATNGSVSIAVDPETTIDIPHLFILWSIISTFYMMTDMLTGFITYAMGIAMIITTTCLNELERDEKLFNGHLFSIYVFVHVIAWISQFAGHFVFERKLIFRLLFPLSFYFLTK